MSGQRPAPPPRVAARAPVPAIAAAPVAAPNPAPLPVPAPVPDIAPAAALPVAAAAPAIAGLPIVKVLSIAVLLVGCLVATPLFSWVAHVPVNQYQQMVVRHSFHQTWSNWTELNFEFDLHKFTPVLQRIGPIRCTGLYSVFGKFRAGFIPDNFAYWWSVRLLRISSTGQEQELDVSFPCRIGPKQAGDTTAPVGGIYRLQEGDHLQWSFKYWADPLPGKVFVGGDAAGWTTLSVQFLSDAL